MRIFIAGPYGDHNPKNIIAQNVRRADLLARALMAVGHQVYCPHTMSWGWEDDPNISREACLALDRSFLRFWAEAICRLPGESPGADAEMEFAAQLGLTVCHADVLLEIANGPDVLPEKGE